MRPSHRTSEAQTGLSPSLIPCSKGLLPGGLPGTPDTTRRSDWQHGLFPLQSPLLRESLLVSFPPLSYMLKFSGSSCLISDPRLKLVIKFSQTLLHPRRRTQHSSTNFTWLACCSTRTFSHLLISGDPCFLSHRIDRPYVHAHRIRIRCRE